MFTTVIAPQELRAHLDDPQYLAIDCRHALADFDAGRRAYDEAHLPGAFFAAVETDLSGAKTGRNGRHPLPDPERFAAFLRSLGADDATQIVAYDVGSDMFAARLWLLCRWIGHDAVAVLDGGLAAWRSLDYPLSASAPVARRAGSLQARPRHDLVVDAAYVQARLGDSHARLLDARSPERFAGENETVDPVGGHIPGAHNRWFKHNFDASGAFKSPEALRASLAEVGDPHAVVHYCGSGVSAAANLLAMERAGMPGSRIYAGSWSEWIADPARPVAKGPAAPG